MVQKKIMQLYIENPNEPKGFTGIIYQLGIHALPGTKFLINQEPNGENLDYFLIGPTGNFSLNCEAMPLQSVWYVEGPQSGVDPTAQSYYPIIIDIVCDIVTKSEVLENE